MAEKRRRLPMRMPVTVPGLILWWCEGFGGFRAGVGVVVGAKMLLACGLSHIGGCLLVWSKSLRSRVEV